MIPIFLLILSALFHSVALAQVDQNCPEGVREVLELACVDQAPNISGADTALARTLRAQELGYTVSGLLSYVIDAEGKVDPRSVRVQRPICERLLHPFIMDLRDWRFSSGIHAGQSVPVRVEHELELHGIRPAWAGPPLEPVTSTRSTPTGLRTEVSYRAVGQRGFAAIDDETTLAVQEAVLTSLLSSSDYDSAAAVCIEAISSGGQRQAELLIARMGEAHPRAVGPADCPPTYISMI